MSLHLNYYYLTIEGRRNFENWRDNLHISEGTDFRVLEYLYKKGPQMALQIANDIKLSPKEVIPHMEAREQAGYIQASKP